MLYHLSFKARDPGRVAATLGDIFEGAGDGGVYPLQVNLPHEAPHFRWLGRPLG